MKETTPEAFLPKLGLRIKQLRLDKGYTSMEKFARDADIPRAQYSRYETGANMTITSILKIAQFHNISLSELFEFGEDANGKKSKGI